MSVETARRRKFPQLKPEHVIALVDTREQTPLCLDPLRMEPATLSTGDYSVRGLEQIISIERKSLGDLLCCIGRERERFDREVMRLMAYPCRALIIESSWQELESGEWRSQITPSQAVGSCIGWMCSGLPIMMAGDHERAGRFVSRLLYCAVRRRWQEARELVAGQPTLLR